MYICIYTCIYKYIYKYVNLNICMNINMYIYMYTCAYIYMYIYIYVYINNTPLIKNVLQIRYIKKCHSIDSCAWCRCIHITDKIAEGAQHKLNMSIHIKSCMYTYENTCIYVHVCTYVHIHKYIYIHRYTHIHQYAIHVHICTCM